VSFQFGGINLNRNVVLQQIGFSGKKGIGANVQDLDREPGVGFVPDMD
jgi:hypothetical protein